MPNGTSPNIPNPNIPSSDGGSNFNIMDILGPLLAGIGGNFLDQQQTRNTITPFDAIRGSEAKGIVGSQSRVQEMLDLFGQLQQGVTPNPQLQRGRAFTEQRATQPITPPSLTRPAQNVNPFLSQLQGQTQNPAGRQLRSQGVDSLFQSLMNRMGTRGQNTGTLTPLGR